MAARSLAVEGREGPEERRSLAARDIDAVVGGIVPVEGMVPVEGTVAVEGILPAEDIVVVEDIPPDRMNRRRSNSYLPWLRGKRDRKSVV